MKNWKLGLTLIAMAGLAATTSAQEAIVENLQEIEATRGWNYRYLGPDFDGANLGLYYQKDFQGECIMFDDNIFAIKTDFFGDKVYFSHGPGTEFTPSRGGIRIGSKVRVRCDRSNDIRWVEVVPYPLWLQRMAERKKANKEN